MRRLLLVNLPSRHRLVRRYVASYYAPNFLIPPLELMALGAVARQRPGWQVLLLDCVALGLDLERAAARVRALAPDLLVTMPGFEVLSEDLDALAGLRRALPPASLVAVFGYLPTQLPELVLRHGACQAVMLGEPEGTFQEMLSALERERHDQRQAQSLSYLAGLPGLATLEQGRLVCQKIRPRISDLDALPWPDHTLIDLGAYSESFMPRPTGAIMTARGCPHTCTFCVRTYGREVTLRSARSLAEEIRHLRRLGIRHVRFMDDTFTLHRGRVLELCARLSRQHREPELSWTALTRLDRVDPVLLARMRRAGCRRLYVGVESASERVLALLRKQLSPAQIRRGMAQIRRFGIEICAFFIVGAPEETAAEIEASIAFALELDPDYIIVTRMQYWPGTELYQAERDRLQLSESPFSCKPEPGRGRLTHQACLRWEQTFYRRFYLRPRTVLRRLQTLGRTPGDVGRGLAELARFVADRGRRHDFI